MPVGTDNVGHAAGWCLQHVWGHRKQSGDGTGDAVCVMCCSVVSKGWVLV